MECDIFMNFVQLAILFCHVGHDARVKSPNPLTWHGVCLYSGVEYERMMRLSRYVALSLVLLGVSACSPQGKAELKANMQAANANIKQALDNAGAVANKFADQARENAYETSYQVQEWAMKKPEVKPPGVIAQRYCYHSLQDILCYRAPMPGAEQRLVAYQGTFAEPPPPAVTQLLPTHPFDSSQLPENRIANATPVFIGLPPDIQEEGPQSPPVIDLNPANIPAERPNPELAPQL